MILNNVKRFVTERSPACNFFAIQSAFVQLEGSHALQYDAVTRQPNGCMAVESCAAKILLEATQCLKKTLAGDDMT
jgi:hypothetical protein